MAWRMTGENPPMGKLWSPSRSAWSSWSCAWGFTPCGRAATVSATWSNKLMRIRVLAQFVAIIIIMAVLYFSQQH